MIQTAAAQGGNSGKLHLSRPKFLCGTEVSSDDGVTLSQYKCTIHSD